MRSADPDFEQLAGEHRSLMRDYGRVQARCSRQLRWQAETIARLEAQAIRLRAAVIVRESALAFAREDRAALESALPGLPRRVALARRVEALVVRLQDLMRDHRPGDRLAPIASGHPTAGREPDDLDGSLAAADLVICQTGCLSHQAYWRVQDHCRRTGKTCVLVERPEALRIVHVPGPHPHPHPARPS